MGREDAPIPLLPIGHPQETCLSLTHPATLAEMCWKGKLIFSTVGRARTIRIMKAKSWIQSTIPHTSNRVRRHHPLFPACICSLRNEGPKAKCQVIGKGSTARTYIASSTKLTMPILDFWGELLKQSFLYPPDWGWLPSGLKSKLQEVQSKGGLIRVTPTMTKSSKGHC